MPKVLPFIIPLVYLALVLGLQPADRLGDPEAVPDLGRVLYDDYDMTAYALRGLNASLGRPAGRLDEPFEVGPKQFTATLQSGAIPEADAPYYLEYPHAALLLFRLPYWLPPSVHDLAIAPTVGEARQHDVVEHEPRTDAERALWRKFRQVLRCYIVVGVGCLVALLAVLRRGYEAGLIGATPVWLLLCPASLYFAANRFDVVPALLTALGLACLGRRHLTASGILFGIATLVKVYPVLLAPLVLRYLDGNRRRAAVWGLAYTVTLGGLLAVTVWQVGWEATLAPYRIQLSRAPEVLTFFGPIFPDAWAQNTLTGKAIRLGGVLAALLLLLWRRPGDLDGLLRRAAVVLLVFVSLQVFYSPQWLLWLMPLLVPLARRQSALVVLVVSLDLVTYLTFPLVFDFGGSPYRAEIFLALIYLRAGLLAALLGVLLWGECRTRFGPALPLDIDKKSC